MKLILQPYFSNSFCDNRLTTTEHCTEGAERNGLGSGQLEEASGTGDVVTKAGTASVRTSGFVGDVARLETASFDFILSTPVSESSFFSFGFISAFDDSTCRYITNRLIMNLNSRQYVKRLNEYKEIN